MIKYLLEWGKGLQMIAQEELLNKYFDSWLGFAYEYVKGKKYKWNIQVFLVHNKKGKVEFVKYNQVGTDHKEELESIIETEGYMPKSHWLDDWTLKRAKEARDARALSN